MENISDSNPNSWRRYDFIGRLKHILTHGIMTDLTIRLVNGVDIKEYYVHSIFFVMASEVFERMLQPSFKEGLTKTIEIKDVKPEILDLLLNYLYGQPLDLSNLDHIKDLCELANYYMMDGLKTDIIRYCESIKTPDIACIGFEIAEICDAPLLKDSKLQYIRNYTQTVLNHQNFLKASPETIITVLDEDNLNIEEIDLFKALEKWIRRNITTTEESLKEILIRKVRYFSMTLKDFVGGPVSSKLLKPEDIVPLVSHLIDEACLIPFPEGFTKIKRSSYFNRLMLTSLPSFTSNSTNFGVSLQVSTKIWLTHLIIYPLINHGEYEETICIEDITNYDIEVARFEGIVKGSDTIEVKLDRPLQLEEGENYNILITVKEGDRLCVNLDGNAIESGGVSFSFKDFYHKCPLHSILFKL